MPKTLKILLTLLIIIKLHHALKYTFMKKIILLPLFILIINMGWSQKGVINGGFEYWTTTIVSETPVGYLEGGQNSVINGGDLTVLKDSTGVHSGKYAARLQTIKSNNDTVSGLLVFANDINGGPNAVWGGFPYTIIPDSFIGYIKYHCAANDSCAVAVMLKKNSVQLFLKFFTIYGDQLAWKRFAYKIPTPSQSPDTIVIAFMSSYDLDNTRKLNPGNWLMVDDVSFTGPSHPMPAIPNSSFETWTTSAYEDPDGWHSFNVIKLIQNQPPYVTKTTPPFSDYYAVSIKTTRWPITQIDSTGLLTTGDVFNGMNKGFAIDSNNVPDSVGFVYKFNNSNSLLDSAGFLISFTKYNLSKNQSDMVSMDVVTLSSTNTFKLKNIKFNFHGMRPDTCNIILSSSHPSLRSLAGIGNEFIIDNIAFYYGGLGLPFNILDKNKGIAYPNPACDVVNFDYWLVKAANINITICDLSGHVIISEIYKGKQGNNLSKIMVSDLAAGNYIYTISDGTRKYSGKLVIVK